MRLRLVALSTLFVGTIVARVDIFIEFSALHELDVQIAEPSTSTSSTRKTADVKRDSKWDESVTSGGNLFAAMQSNGRKALWLFRNDPHNHHNSAYQTVQSPHEGDLKDILAKWGYSDYDDDAKKKRTIDMDCDFERTHSLKRAFDALGIRTGSAGKARPNQCFQIDRKDGPKILRDKENKLPSIGNQQYIDESCGKVYRVSQEN
jgi:hypothetical protein